MDRLTSQLISYFNFVASPILPGVSETLKYFSETCIFYCQISINTDFINAEAFKNQLRSAAFPISIIKSLKLVFLPEAKMKFPIDFITQLN